ncbi:hypothetical protein [Flexithrix dorotheae]|uniref:hypothetical protein n=1 Tax=Flexithrix dorotheae TaxID=70993 RepID=UPI00039B4BF1|nr:hypothetical protein [Flexithrix dorotheae]
MKKLTLLFALITLNLGLNNNLFAYQEGDKPANKEINDNRDGNLTEQDTVKEILLDDEDLDLESEPKMKIIVYNQDGDLVYSAEMDEEDFEQKDLPYGVELMMNYGNTYYYTVDDSPVDQGPLLQ